MTFEEATKEVGELEDWYKEPGEVVSWTSPIESIGVHLFSFDDGRNVFSVFGGGENELTEEQMKIFERENPIMAHLYASNKEYKFTYYG